MNGSFAEKVVLITRGTSGIGRATAVAFAEQGANVVISGRREAEGAESVSLIQKAGGQGLFVRGDVSEESEIEALVAKTLERFGRLDFAFNNAEAGPADAGGQYDRPTTECRWRQRLLVTAFERKKICREKVSPERKSR